jgi:hypothetical protein
VSIKALASLLLLAACASEAPTSISLSTTSVTFQATTSGPAPAAQNIHVTFKGDGVLVGYPPGVAQPAWLNVTEVSSTGTTLDVALRIADYGTPGTRTTTLRFVTGKADGSHVTYADVQVTCQVTYVAPAPTSISASTAAVTFRAERGAALPASLLVQVVFDGDAAVVGSPPGSFLPSWLRVTQISRTATSLEVALAVTDTATLGARSATLRFTTGRSGADVKYADVEIGYTVITPFGATAPTMSFAAVGGATLGPQPAAGYAIDIQGDDALWRATTTPSWLALSQASGAGPGSVAVTASATGLATGSHQGTVVVTDDASGRQVSFNVTLTLRAPHLTVSPVAAFDVGLGSPPSALTQLLAVSDEIGGTSAAWASSWAVASISADWLRWSPASGTSSPPVPVTLSVDAAKLAALSNGSHAASVVLSYTNADGTGQTLVVPVVLTTCLPHVDRVMPYLATASQGGHLYIRGSGFSCTGPMPSATLGTTGLTRTVDSDTQMQADYPAMAAGRYALHLDNLLGIELGTADVLVLAPPAMSYQAITAPSTRGRLVYDAERETLYAVNRTDQSIERYARSGTTWSALSPIIVPSVRDVDLAPDGRSLLVASVGAIGEIDLTAATPTVVQRAINPDTFCGGYFAQLAIPNGGKAFLVFGLASCSGFSESYLYDMRDYTLKRSTMLYNGFAAASADGSRVYMGSNGVSPAQPVYILNALDNSITSGPANYNLFAATVSGDASRVILQGADVYSRSLSLTGHVPLGGGVVVSRDSSKAFVYRDDGAAGARVEVYDLNGALGAGALYPLAKTIPLASAPNGATGWRVQMAVTPDGSAVFVSGNARILVVPVI